MGDGRFSTVKKARIYAEVGDSACGGPPEVNAAEYVDAASGVVGDREQSLCGVEKPGPRVHAGTERHEVVGRDADGDRLSVAGDRRAGSGVVDLADLDRESAFDEARPWLVGE
jgi:hypothetical protein